MAECNREKLTLQRSQDITTSQETSLLSASKEASLLKKMLQIVDIPETFPLAPANIEEGARLDVASDGFWGSCHQRVFIDVEVFNPNASSYKASSLSPLYHRFEKEKQRKYEQCIREVEMGCFTPWEFPLLGR